MGRDDRRGPELRGDDPAGCLGGPKVGAFFRLLVRPRDPRIVCVDRHAVADAYRIVARAVGERPSAVQAATWVAHRRGLGIVDRF